MSFLINKLSYKSILFTSSILLLLLFEWVKVYLIMPMPGSQSLDCVELAYFLHNYRWLIRSILLLIISVSFGQFFFQNKILTSSLIFFLLISAYLTNYKMSADSMFLQTNNLVFSDVQSNKVDEGRIILGVEINGESKAYPVQYLGYHHQVRDVLGGKEIMITYCTVCRTGRVFDPVVNGRVEQFRLVGMDHFNAMFEDVSTKSWWRQVTGEAIVGKSKGMVLTEIPMIQLELKKWIALYPQTKIMQADSNFKIQYDSMSLFEIGKYYGKLTKRDTISGTDKSWVVRLKGKKENKSIDWNELVRNKIITGQIDDQAFSLVLFNDLKSFVAFTLPDSNTQIKINEDTLFIDSIAYNLLGIPLDKSKPQLNRITAYQEYLHTSKTFY
ncbi:MAG: DUF3179 domain-containing protein [Saprospiraceae bacterium]|nr:DUF3179 domain-containing protein [Saprospiraceae bacterium]